MKSRLTVSLLIALFGFCANCGRGRADQKYATVKFVVLDSFGTQQPDCQVANFVLGKDWTLPRVDSTDFKANFHNMLGRNIPLSPGYTARITCGEYRTQVPVWVNDTEQLVVVSFWPHLGDYVTGLSPRLSIRIRTRGEASAFDSSNSWVQVLGLYIDYRNVGRIDQTSAEAHFYDLVPGSYLLTVETKDGTSCRQPLDITGSHAKVALEISKDACNFDPAAFVEASPHYGRRVAHP